MTKPRQIKLFWSFLAVVSCAGRVLLTAKRLHFPAQGRGEAAHPGTRFREATVYTEGVILGGHPNPAACCRTPSAFRQTSARHPGCAAAPRPLGWGVQRLRRTLLEYDGVLVTAAVWRALAWHVFGCQCGGANLACNASSQASAQLRSGSDGFIMDNLPAVRTVNERSLAEWHPKKCKGGAKFNCHAAGLISNTGVAPCRVAL